MGIKAVQGILFLMCTEVTNANRRSGSGSENFKGEEAKTFPAKFHLSQCAALQLHIFSGKAPGCNQVVWILLALLVAFHGLLVTSRDPYSIQKDHDAAGAYSWTSIGMQPVSMVHPNFKTLVFRPLHHADARPPCGSCRSIESMKDVASTREWSNRKFRGAFLGMFDISAVFIVIFPLSLIPLSVKVIRAAMRAKGQSRQPFFVTRCKTRGTGRYSCLLSNQNFSLSNRGYYVALTLLMLIHCRSVLAQSFSSKAIGLSNPVAGAMTVVTDTVLTAAANSSVTISGFIGAVGTNPVTLLDAGDDGEISFSDGVTQGRAALSSGTLALTVNAGESLAAGTTCRFSFEIKNPSVVTTSPTVNIAALGSIVLTAMMKLGTALFGVALGVNPLEGLVPFFGIKSIEQSTRVSGATNTLTVTLTANYELMAGSMVTISGLTGSHTADNPTMAVTSTSNFQGGVGAWTQTKGSLVLTAGSSGIMAGTPCVVMFDLQNTAADQASPTVNVVADIHCAISGGSIVSIGAIAEIAMTKRGLDLYGFADSANPLRLLLPSFGVKSIEQSTPVSSATITLAVKLTANYDPRAASTVTISGLTGSQAADNTALAVALTSSLFGTAGAWTEAGQLVLTVVSMVTILGTACVVTKRIDANLRARVDLHGALGGPPMVVPAVDSYEIHVMCNTLPVRV